MDLEERKRRLKMFLEMESDKEMLRAWVGFSNTAEEFDKLSDEEKMEKWKETFHLLIHDEGRMKRMGYCSGLVKTFMETVCLIDGLSVKRTAKITNEVLNSLTI